MVDLTMFENLTDYYTEMYNHVLTRTTPTKNVFIQHQWTNNSVKTGITKLRVCDNLTPDITNMPAFKPVRIKCTIEFDAYKLSHYWGGAFEQQIGIAFMNSEGYYINKYYIRFYGVINTTALKWSLGNSYYSSGAQLCYNSGSVYSVDKSTLFGDANTKNFKVEFYVTVFKNLSGDYYSSCDLDILYDNTTIITEAFGETLSPLTAYSFDHAILYVATNLAEPTSDGAYFAITLKEMSI